MSLYEQIEIEANKLKTARQGLRLGQCLMIILNDISPNLYKRVSENGSCDCFYNDSRIEKFKEFVNGGIR